MSLSMIVFGSVKSRVAFLIAKPIARSGQPGQKVGNRAGILALNELKVSWDCWMRALGVRPMSFAMALATSPVENSLNRGKILLPTMGMLILFCCAIA